MSKNDVMLEKKEGNYELFTLIFSSSRSNHLTLVPHYFSHAGSF